MYWMTKTFEIYGRVIYGKQQNAENDCFHVRFGRANTCPFALISKFRTKAVNRI